MTIVCVLILATLLRSDNEDNTEDTAADVSTMSDIVIETPCDGEQADNSGASDLSMSALVPETTLQEGTEEVVREPGECSPPRLDEVERAVVEFPCPECDRTFDLKIKLNRHLKLHTKKNDLKAGAGFVTPLRVKSEPGITPSKSTGKRAPKNWIEPPEGEGHSCPECGKRFKVKTAMLRHFEDLHQPGEFPCKGCGKIFTSKNKQSSHYSRNCKQRMQ